MRPGIARIAKHRQFLGYETGYGMNCGASSLKMVIMCY